MESNLEAVRDETGNGEPVFIHSITRTTCEDVFDEKPSQLAKFSIGNIVQQSGICRFCRVQLKDHVWSEFAPSTSNEYLIPPQCSLHHLIDQIVRDSLPKNSKAIVHTVNNEFLDVFMLDELLKPKLRFQYDISSWGSHQMYPASTVDEQLQEIDKWLQSCCKSHIRCQGMYEGPIPAKRILDLATMKTGIVKLVEASNLNGPYACLSYCWGEKSSHPPMTTKSNLTKNLSGIDYESLPKCFQHAFKVCQHWNLRYIWIDCLCIVQDDKNEWLIEAEKMVDIYSDSFITIVAAQSFNSRQGFLNDFPDSEMFYRLNTKPASKTATQKYVMCVTVARNSDSMPIYDRAWCLQEWLLAPRIVEFHIDNISFSCKDSEGSRQRSHLHRPAKFDHRSIWAEMEGWGIEVRSYMDDMAQIRSVLHEKESAKKGLIPLFWLKLTSNYCSRKITHWSDRLPALAGLAKRVATVLDDQYLAGLWKESLIADLCWTKKECSEELFCQIKSIEGLPSWSWISLTTGVVHRVGQNPYDQPAKSEDAELVSTNCHGFSSLRELPATITLSGLTTVMFIRVEPSTQQHTRGYRLLQLHEILNDVVLSSHETIVRTAPDNCVISCNPDMEIGPLSHEHKNAPDLNSQELYLVPYISRKLIDKCEKCCSTGYISKVRLILLRYSMGLVLAPIPRKHSDAVQLYQRIGLFNNYDIAKALRTSGNDQEAVVIA